METTRKRTRSRCNCSIGLRGRLRQLCPILLVLVMYIVLTFTLAVDANSDRETRQTQHRHNILLLLTDDQDIALGSFDTSKYMPKLHRYLVQEGIRAKDGAIVHVPICCPNRASLLTGKYLHHGSLAHNNSISGNCYSKNWKHDEEDHHTIAVHAQRAGYTTLYAGKYMNQYRHYKKSKDNTISPDSIPKGWDYWYGLEGNSRYYNYTIVERDPSSSNMNQSATLRLHHHGNQYPDDYLPLVLENYTLSKLPQLPEPWLMVVAWPTPHGPFTPEPRYDKKYSNVVPPRGENYNATTTSQQQKHWLLRQLGVITENTAIQIDEIYRNRLRALVTVDNHVGKLVQWLENTKKGNTNTENAPNDESDRAFLHKTATAQRRLANDETSNPSVTSTINEHATTMMDRTVIMYTSDNGFQFGQHRLSIDKRHLYEHDVRVPFVVRGPKGILPKNLTLGREIMVSTLDIAPTILDIVAKGFTTTMEENNRLSLALQGMDGLSFWSFLKGLHTQTTQPVSKSSGRSSSVLPLYSDFDTNCGNKEENDDPFALRTDLLISYHGEGNPKCGLSECPAPLHGLWWMPDSYNNTYHCLRTIQKVENSSSNSKNKNSCRGKTNGVVSVAEDSIYCVFDDHQNFVEYYNLRENPYQLGNDYHSLSAADIGRYERRLQELLS